MKTCLLEFVFQNAWLMLFQTRCIFIHENKNNFPNFSSSYADYWRAALKRVALMSALPKVRARQECDSFYLKRGRVERHSFFRKWGLWAILWLFNSKSGKIELNFSFLGPPKMIILSKYKNIYLFYNLYIKFLHPFLKKSKLWFF